MKMRRDMVKVLSYRKHQGSHGGPLVFTALLALAWCSSAVAECSATEITLAEATRLVHSTETVLHFEKAGGVVGLENMSANVNPGSFFTLYVFNNARNAHWPGTIGTFAVNKFSADVINAALQTVETGQALSDVQRELRREHCIPAEVVARHLHDLLQPVPAP
jgi:hypothetical protein